MLEKLKELRVKLLCSLENLDSPQALEEFRVQALGKKAELSLILRQMGELSVEMRKEVGQLANEVRNELEEKLKNKREIFQKALLQKQLEQEKIDLTFPSQEREIGALHPLTQVTQRIEDIFLGLGFRVAEGPEVEWLSYNFDRLRIPENHPAREEKDTFYIDEKRILRTQTSPVQIRVMEEKGVPIKIIAPGRVYRPDTPDATHSPVFHQIEGLVIDKDVSMGDLVGTLQLFAKCLFGEKTKIRLRPHHFPFTEPSCEVDVTCWKCHGQGCPTCKQEGYVEILGAGMVHPYVLEQCGIDPEVYSGFAFGIGVERTTMANFNINDIRHFFENNLQFLKQFK